MMFTLCCREDLHLHDMILWCFVFPASGFSYSFLPVEKSDSGEYTCQAWNAVGSESAVLNMDVHCE